MYIHVYIYLRVHVCLGYIHDIVHVCCGVRKMCQNGQKLVLVHHVVGVAIGPIFTFFRLRLDSVERSVYTHMMGGWGDVTFCSLIYI